MFSHIWWWLLKVLKVQSALKITFHFPKQGWEFFAQTRLWTLHASVSMYFADGPVSLQKHQLSFEHWTFKQLRVRPVLWGGWRPDVSTIMKPYRFWVLLASQLTSWESQMPTSMGWEEPPLQQTKKHVFLPLSSELKIGSPHILGYVAIWLLEHWFVCSQHRNPCSDESGECFQLLHVCQLDSESWAP